MEPTELGNGDAGGLGEARLQEIARRLREVRRHCFNDADVGDCRETAVDLIEAVVADLEASMDRGAGSMAAQDLDVGLATVEEMFRAGNAQGFVRVIASIRGSLTAPDEEPKPVDVLPPPRRFQPSPNDAVRRRRPKPKVEAQRTSKAAAPRPGGSGRLILALVVIVAAGVISVVVLQRRDSAEEMQGTVKSAAVDRSVEEGYTAPLDIPTMVPQRRLFENDYDYQEEAMARFTLEIRLAESALADGDLNESVRHFATAAAIDRHHQRVIAMGKALIAAFMQDADRAHDAGNLELAGRRIKSARDLARGLRLDESKMDYADRKHAAMTRFDDISPRDSTQLQRAVGHPVRLTLKSKDVVFGHLIGFDGEFLAIDVYSGLKGGAAEFDARILSSTIREVRVYDAKDPAEIITGD